MDRNSIFDLRCRWGHTWQKGVCEVCKKTRQSVSGPCGPAFDTAPQISNQDRIAQAIRGIGLGPSIRHIWSRCICTMCGETRDEGHSWDGCICSRCGTTRHEWRGCTCTACGAHRDQEHEWSYSTDFKKCTKCGKIRERNTVEYSKPATKCWVCGGTGKMTCITCGGSGTTTITTPGLYQTTTMRSTCAACVGRGRRTCEECHGRGYS